MGLEVRGCVNQLELFTFERALKTPSRFHASVLGGLYRFQSEPQEKEEEAN